ncbi:hypothetical protein [Streptomyces sp. NPDC008139]|uniref:hypothetical protein n=1 Tax=Streptomyces sp. NPDC008139 TaxID=3364814 RepID=UPI0036E61A05
MPRPALPPSVAGTAVLSAGYGWLGAVLGGTPGAVAGAVLGLGLSALLFLLLDRAVTGRSRGRARAARTFGTSGRRRRRGHGGPTL